MALKISVVTVCYNARRTISDALISVARQTHPLVEHIVVDGASSDGTQEIVAQHLVAGGKFVSEPDRGIYDAMNKGIALCTGDVIGLLNADDLYPNDNVLARVATIMEKEELDALLGDVEFCRDPDLQSIVRRYDSGRFSPKRIPWGWMPAHPAMFLRRTVYDEVGSYRTDYKIAGDFEFVVRAFYHHTLRYRHLPDALVRMRLGGISTGGWRSTLTLNRESVRACRENGVYSNMLMIMSKYPRKIMEFRRRS